MREYIRTRSANIQEEPDGENYLARTVYESHELIDIGILDEAGNKIMARERMAPIGFVHFQEPAMPKRKPCKPKPKG